MDRLENKEKRGVDETEVDHITETGAVNDLDMPSAI